MPTWAASPPTRREPVPGWRPWETGFETLSDPTSNPATWLTCHPARPRRELRQRLSEGRRCLCQPQNRHVLHTRPLQSRFPGPNVIETPLRVACQCHSPRLAMSLPSGTHPFQKCSLFTSSRGAICHRFSLPTTRFATSRQNSNSCTRPALRGTFSVSADLARRSRLRPLIGDPAHPLPGPSTAPTYVVRRLRSEAAPRPPAEDGG